jgi:hypothetical protein
MGLNSTPQLLGMKFGWVTVYSARVTRACPHSVRLAKYKKCVSNEIEGNVIHLESCTSPEFCGRLRIPDLKTVGT